MKEALAAAREHPVIVGVFTLCAIAGVVVAVALQPDDWGLPRTVAAGVFSGLGVALIVVTTRLLGQ